LHSYPRRPVRRNSRSRLLTEILLVFEVYLSDRPPFLQLIHWCNGPLKVPSTHRLVDLSFLRSSFTPLFRISNVRYSSRLPEPDYISEVRRSPSSPFFCCAVFFFHDRWFLARRWLLVSEILIPLRVRWFAIYNDPTSSRPYIRAFSFCTASPLSLLDSWLPRSRRGLTCSAPSLLLFCPGTIFFLAFFSTEGCIITFQGSVRLSLFLVVISLFLITLVCL